MSIGFSVWVEKKPGCDHHLKRLDNRKMAFVSDVFSREIDLTAVFHLFRFLNNSTTRTAACGE